MRCHERDRVAENHCSMGALLRVRKSHSGESLLGFLTLGDMTPSNDSMIARVLDDNGAWDEIDLLKFPHHGSDHNCARGPKTRSSK